MSAGPRIPQLMNLKYFQRDDNIDRLLSHTDIIIAAINAISAAAVMIAHQLQLLNYSAKPENLNLANVFWCGIHL